MYSSSTLESVPKYILWCHSIQVRIDKAEDTSIEEEKLARDWIEWPIKSDDMWTYVFDGKWSILLMIRWWWELKYKGEQIAYDTQVSFQKLVVNALNKYLGFENQDSE